VRRRTNLLELCELLAPGSSRFRHTPEVPASGSRARLLEATSLCVQGFEERQRPWRFVHASRRSWTA
jgi:hypothetical protein